MKHKCYPPKGYAMMIKDFIENRETTPDYLNVIIDIASIIQYWGKEKAEILYHKNMEHLLAFVHRDNAKNPRQKTKEQMEAIKKNSIANGLTKP